MNMEDLTLNEYQEKRVNKFGGLVGSYFPDYPAEENQKPAFLLL